MPRVYTATASGPDGLYGGRPALGLQRQALHAWRLVLPHPVHGGLVEVHCAPPPDFDAAWRTVAGSVGLE